jgi:phosphoglycolate phosphatase
MPRQIYFDLDGTLTDPFEGITKSILYALDHLETPAPDGDTLHRFIGPPLHDTFRELVGAEQTDRAIALYRERFADVGWQENVPYEGIHAALESLVSAGHTLFVATTKPHIYARRIVEHFGLAGYFDVVFGSELDGTRVDKTDLLRWALPQNPARGTPTMVGDRRHDIVGALNNGMEVLGVSYGYGSVAELTASGAKKIASTPAEIPQILR